MGSLLVNMKAYDEAHAKGDKEAMDALEESLTKPLPLLKNLGLFDLFTPEEWEARGGEGKKFVGRKAREMGF